MMRMQSASQRAASDIPAPKRDNSVSNFRFLCIFLMTFAHNYFASGLRDFVSQLPYAAQHSPLSFASLTLFDGFARISIPFLGCLAGYFVSMNLREQTYVTVVKRRFVSLYLPVIFWSFFYFGLMIAVGYATADYNYISRKLATVHLDDFLGLTKWPINYPLHYLVSLFKCVLIAPILIFILRRFGPPIYLLTVVISFLLLVGTDLRHGVAGTHENSFWPRAEILFFFSIGIFANRRWNVPVSAALERVRIKSTALLLVTLLIFVGGTLHWRWLVQQSGDFMLWSGFFALTAVRISGTLLVLSLLPWLRKLASVGIYCNDRLTFILFCTHIISFHILPKALESARWNVNDTALFLVAPLFAVVLACILFWLERWGRQALFRPRSPALERGPVLEG